MLYAWSRVVRTFAMTSFVQSTGPNDLRRAVRAKIKQGSSPAKATFASAVTCY